LRKRVALAVVTTAVAILLLTAFLLQTVDNNNLTKTDGILTATINGANFVRNQMIEVKGKVDDADITPESGVWISVKDPTNKTTQAIFVPVNAEDKSFSFSIVAGYYDGNSYGFYKPISVSGKNYTMTVAYNTKDGSSSTASSSENKSQVQFVFAYDHSTTTPPLVSAATAPAEEDTGPASGASQFAGNQSSTTTTTPTNMSTPTTTTTARPTTTTTMKTNGLLTATINDTYFTTNQTILVDGTVGEGAGPSIAVYVELKDPQNDTLAFDFAPIVRSNKSGSDNETSFSYTLVAGHDDSDAASDSNDTRRFWKPMNETGNNYTMIVGYATPALPPSSSSSSSGSGSAEENSRSEVQFVFAYEHLLPPEEEGAAVATTTTPEEEPEPEPEPVIEPEPEPEEEESEDDGDDDNGGGDDSGDDGDDCDNSYPDVCIPPPPPVLECGDIDEDDFEVRGSDPHGFDDDNDGVGCEEDSSSSSSSSDDDDDSNDDSSSSSSSSNDDISNDEIDGNRISNALTNTLDDIFGDDNDNSDDR
jgi:hypothetical protein